MELELVLKEDPSKWEDVNMTSGGWTWSNLYFTITVILVLSLASQQKAMIMMNKRSFRKSKKACSSEPGACLRSDKHMKQSPLTENTLTDSGAELHYM